MVEGERPEVTRGAAVHPLSVAEVRIAFGLNQALSDELGAELARFRR